METERIGLPAVHLQGIHQEEVVERMSRRARRGRDIQVEDADLIPVEVGFQEVRAGELAEDVVLFEAGDPASFDDFLVHGGLQRMVFPRRRLRDHDRNIGSAGDGRGVPVIQDESQRVLEESLVNEVLGMGGVQLDLAVQTGLPGLGQFGIVLRPGAVDPVQDGPEVAVVRLDEGRLELPHIFVQQEVDLREGTFGNRHRLGFVPNQMCRQGRNLLGTGFEGEVAVQVRRDADDGPVEIDAGERDGLSRFGIADGAFDLGGLGCGGESQEEEKEKEVSFHNQKSISRPTFTAKSRPFRCVSFQKQSTRRRWKMLAMPTPAST